MGVFRSFFGPTNLRDAGLREQLLTGVRCGKGVSMYATVLSLVLCVGGGESADFGAWYLDYAKALREVERQDKPLFIVFDKVESDLGKAVASDEFLNEQVEKALAADYVRMYVNVESERGQKLAEQFGATQFPRLVVIDRSTEWQVYRRSGTHSADDVQSVLARYRRSKITNTGGTTVIESSYWGTSSSSTTTILCKT